MIDVNLLTKQEPDSPSRHKKCSELKDFDIVELLGSGAFGKVYKTIHLSTKHEFALKIIEKTSLSTKAIESVLSEAKILGSLNHHNIVKFYQLVENKENIYIFMELVKHGSLLELIRRRVDEGVYFSDDEASRIIRSVLAAITYIHAKNIVHRDIKPQNILICDPVNVGHVKLIDFGLSCLFDDYFVTVFTQKCGTLYYMAPELIKGQLYSKPVDIWSVGIIMMELINKGQHPFDEKKNTKNLIIEKIRNPQWKFSENFTEFAKDLFLKLTNEDPHTRYTAEQALDHPWITRRFNETIPLTFDEKIRTISLQNSLFHKILAIFFVNRCAMDHSRKLNEEAQKSFLKRKSCIEKPISIQDSSKKKNFKQVLRISKTLNISNESTVNNIEHTDNSFSEAIESNNNILHTPSKIFRIKTLCNSATTKPFNSLNNAIILTPSNSNDKSLNENQAIEKKLIEKSEKTSHLFEKPSIDKQFLEKSVIEKPVKKTLVTKKKSHFFENDVFNSESPRSIDSKNKALPPIDKNSNSEKGSSVMSMKLEPLKLDDNKLYTFDDKMVRSTQNSPLKKKIVISPCASTKSKEKRGSLQHENIILDKETLRDLNRFTDKNFIKSIKASFRKLEIIEKINEDTLLKERVFKGYNRNPSSGDMLNGEDGGMDKGKEFKLPFISPCGSPMKRNSMMKNYKIVKN